MRKILQYIFTGLLGVALSSCSDELKESVPVEISGEEIRIGITFEIEKTVEIGEPSFFGGETRSIVSGDIDEMTLPGKKPKNMWVVQYDETGKLVGSPYYLDYEDPTISKTSIPALHSGTAIHTLFFLANTFDPNMEWGDYRNTPAIAGTGFKYQARIRLLCYHRRRLQMPADEWLFPGGF